MDARTDREGTLVEGPPPEGDRRFMEEGVLRCAACGALWRSVAAQQLVRERGCLSCGGGPIVETEKRPPDQGSAGTTED
jgi:hypothetical protein